MSVANIEPGFALLPFKWLDAFSIEIPEIDADHRKLIDLSEKLTHLLRINRQWSRVVAVLKSIRKYWVAHCRREERILNTDKYPDIVQHQQEHRRITQSMDRIIALLSGASKRGSSTDVETASMFRSMIIDHMLLFDLAYKSHVLYARGR